jgi:hypothetical protein
MFEKIPNGPTEIPCYVLYLLSLAVPIYPPSLVPLVITTF